MFFPSFPLLCEISIEIWRIEVVEAQVEDSVSPVRKSPDRVCHYCIFDLLIDSCPIHVHLNMNIESMDAFTLLYMNDYICYSSSMKFLYISCFLCLLLLRAKCKSNCIGKTQRGSTSTIQNKVQFYIP